MITLLKKAAVAAIIASAVNVAVFYIANNVILSEAILIRQGPPGTPLTPLGPGPIIVFSSLPAFLAAGLLFVLQKYTARPVRIFQVLGIIILLASFLAPHSLPTPLSQNLTLDLMHLIAAVTTIAIFSKRNPSQSQAASISPPQQNR